jgi:hypothetical protein
MFWLRLGRAEDYTVSGTIQGEMATLVAAQPN